MKLSPLPILGFFEKASEISEERAGDDRLMLFRDLYEQQNHTLRRMLAGIVGREHCDDLVQETFLKAWKSWNEFRGESQAKTWIHRIAINTALDFKKRKKADLVADVDQELEAQTGVNIAVSGLEKEKLLGDLIEKGIQRLGEEHRIAFILYYRVEFSIEEIAATLEIPSGTVKSRLFKARERFVEFLSHNGVSYDS